MKRLPINVRYIFQLLLVMDIILNETAKTLNSEGVMTARANRRKEIKGYDAYANSGNLL